LTDEAVERVGRRACRDGQEESSGGHTRRLGGRRERRSASSIVIPAARGQARGRASPGNAAWPSRSSAVFCLSCLEDVLSEVDRKLGASRWRALRSSLRNADIPESELRGAIADAARYPPLERLRDRRATTGGSRAAGAHRRGCARVDAGACGQLRAIAAGRCPSAGVEGLGEGVFLLDVPSRRLRRPWSGRRSCVDDHLASVRDLGRDSLRDPHRDARTSV
jgi:hypothetical protein